MDTQTEILHPELEQHLYPDGRDGYHLKHPLFFVLNFDESKIHYANEIFRSKQEKVQQALDEENYDKFIFLHERPYRVEALDSITGNLDDVSYWSFVRSIWLDTENANQVREYWENLWSSDRPRRLETLMTEAERNFLSSQTGALKVYRGFLEKGGQNGLSWTLDSKKAEWFARRFKANGQPAYVASGELPVEQVRAYFSSRGEEEIVVDCDHLPNNIKIKMIR